jgi:cellulose synthase/poly-beta-1,6-N-acetylglucosamine synthase-like glycosyltransferase
MSLAAGGALALAGAPLCFACLYLLVLAVASFRRPAEGNAMPDHDRCLVVLVPAHDEQELIGRCVRSLLEQDYPRHLYRIVVIADNCTDATAALAREAGAEVIERTDPARRGKGQALRWAMDGWLAGAEPADGFVIIDADSVVESQLLSSMGAALKRGVEVAQADYSVLPEPSAKAQLVAAGFLLFHRVRFGGRAALGLPACSCSLSCSARWSQ